MLDVHTAGNTLIALFELIAVDRIVLIKSEVIPQLQTAADQIGISGCRPAVTRSVPGSRKTITTGLATVAGVYRVPATNQARIERTLGNLVGRVPLTLVGHRGDRVAVLLAAVGVAQHAVEPAKIIRFGPRAIGSQHFQRIHQIAVGSLRCVRQQKPTVTETANPDLGHRTLEPVRQQDVHRTSSGEVTVFRRVRTFPVLHTIDEIRNQEIQIAVALPMSMRTLIDRHSVDTDRQIGSMIKIHATQKILIRLTFTAVLGHDDARRPLQ